MIIFDSNSKKEIIQPRKIIRQNSIYTKTLKEKFFLTIRLINHSKQQPIILLFGIIQPFLWLLLFKPLFKNLLIKTQITNMSYNQFLNPGLIVFAVFSSSINSGISLIFDREFGFLNRILIMPLQTIKSLYFAFNLFNSLINCIQSIILLKFFCIKNNNFFLTSKFYLTLLTIKTLTKIISKLSIDSALTLPGHIEFLSLGLILNLPVLFLSTALAPLKNRPLWLQLIASLNPLTYATEIIRYLYTTQSLNLFQNIIQIKTIRFNLIISLSILILCEHAINK
uniref:Ycf38 n=1 Tax=Pterocladiophila hemisphaerica TaxID=2712948 RepID=A0A6M3WWK7_9FLOR|nr:Ycf38 [Pterocladiophila hemisphaerica]